jgi:hypothetical protein
MNNKRNFRWNKGFIFFVIFIPAVLFLGFVVMLLWNGILPGVIHVSSISYPQALGILLLSKILFGGFNKRHWGPERRHAMHEKFANMTPEEREKFKAEWRNRCNRWGMKQETSSPGTAS